MHFDCGKLRTMKNNSLSFDKFDTLLEWKNSSYLYPFTPRGESFRGGAFWCIPNQGPTYDIFEVQNGEYRKTEKAGDTRQKHLAGKWGEIESSVSWEEVSGSLKSAATITALRNNTLIRPGFHPYFKVSGNFVITIGKKTLTNETIVQNDRLTIVVHNEGRAIIEQEYSKTELSFIARSNGPEMTISFCVWTDDKEKYICIEPVIGKDIAKEELFDGSPAPLALKKGDSVTIECVISSSSL